MQTILFFVFLGLFIVSSVLHVFAYTKKIKLMEYICKPFMYATLITAAVFALIPKLPDSKNILFCTCFSLGLGMIADCLLLISKKRKIIILSGILYMLSCFGWLNLMWPSFKLFILPTIQTVILCSFYIILFVIFYMFSIGKLKIKKMPYVTVYLLPMVIFHYSSILTLIGQPKLYSLILLIGSTTLLISEGFIIKGFFYKAGKILRFFRMFLFTISQLLITAGFVLMIN